MAFSGYGFGSGYDYFAETPASKRQKIVRAALEKAGVTRIDYRFSGGGDESHVNGYDSKEEVDLHSINVAIADYEGNEQTVSLFDVIGDVLDDQIGGEYDYEYGYGHGSWLITTDKFTSHYECEYNRYNDEGGYDNDF